MAAVLIVAFFVASGLMFRGVAGTTLMGSNQGHAGMMSMMQNGNSMMSSVEESGTKPEPGSSSTTDSSAPVVTIVRGASMLDDRAYSPNPLVAKAGTKVRFVNEDPVPHTVTGKDSGAFDSGIMNKGEYWEFTFEKDGTYDYYCMLHPSMVGTIQVSE